MVAHMLFRFRSSFSTRRLVPLFVLASLVAGCAAPSHTSASASAAPKTSEPLNLSAAKAAVLAYVDSGAYARDFAAVAARASAWIGQRADARRPGERLAVVLDIDETVLSNLPHMRAEEDRKSVV